MVTEVLKVNQPEQAGLSVQTDLYILKSNWETVIVRTLL